MACVVIVDSDYSCPSISAIFYSNLFWFELSNSVWAVVWAVAWAVVSAIVWTFDSVWAVAWTLDSVWAVVWTLDYLLPKLLILPGYG